MSAGTRVALAEAGAIALDLVIALRSACERIEVAGSIRRGRADVGDIELVAIPRIEMVADGLFGSSQANRLTERVDQMIVGGVLRSHPSDSKRGDRYSKVLHHSGLQVDLFSASRDTFGLILLIRTGPADYSHRFVTDLRRRALHVAKGELHRGGLGCGEYACEVVLTPAEEDVYLAADWPYVKPGMRA